MTRRVFLIAGALVTIPLSTLRSVSSEIDTSNYIKSYLYASMSNGRVNNVITHRDVP